MQAQRFKRIRGVDMKSKMKEFMGTDVTFRGKQEETITAIMKRGKPNYMHHGHWRREKFAVYVTNVL